MTTPSDKQREMREMKRNKRQSESNFDAEDTATAAEEVNTRSTPTQLIQELGPQPNETRPMQQETDQTINPDNPYNVSIWHHRAQDCGGQVILMTRSGLSFIYLNLHIQFFSTKHVYIQVQKGLLLLPPSTLVLTKPQQDEVLEVARSREADEKLLLKGSKKY